MINGVDRILASYAWAPYCYKHHPEYRSTKQTTDQLTTNFDGTALGEYSVARDSVWAT
jgi:hypothetical protein